MTIYKCRNCGNEKKQYLPPKICDCCNSQDFYIDLSSHNKLVNEYKTAFEQADFLKRQYQTYTKYSLTIALLIFLTTMTIIIYLQKRQNNQLKSLINNIPSPKPIPSLNNIPSPKPIPSLNNQNQIVGKVNLHGSKTLLSLRKEARITTNNILTKLTDGTELKILAKIEGEMYQVAGQKRNDWYQVEVESKQGYIAGYYIDLILKSLKY